MVDDSLPYTTVSQSLKSCSSSPTYYRRNYSDNYTTLHNDSCRFPYITCARVSLRSTISDTFESKWNIQNTTKCE